MFSLVHPLLGFLCGANERKTFFEGSMLSVCFGSSISFTFSGVESFNEAENSPTE